MNSKKEIFLCSALATLGIAGSLGTGSAQANSLFKTLDRSSDQILLAKGNSCGKGSCGTDKKGAEAAQKAHGSKKTKEASCKTSGTDGKEASCSTHDKDASGGAGSSK